MFEALFILTTIDTGTRVARFILQEMLGKVYRPLGSSTWMPGVVLTSALICLAWGGLLYGGTISTIWPMFGLANQLLAALGLAIGTSYLLRAAPRRVYAATTFLPFVVLAVTTYVAGFMNLATYMEKSTRVFDVFFVNALLSIAMLVLSTVIVLVSFRDWLNGRAAVPAAVQDSPAA